MKLERELGQSFGLARIADVLDARLKPGILHFLGICPKHSYKRELQSASDTTAIPACSIRRREGKTTLQTATGSRSRRSYSQKIKKNNYVYQIVQTQRKRTLQGSAVQLELGLGFTDRKFGS